MRDSQADPNADDRTAIPGNASRITPTYAAAFHCIGTDCEDHCCKHWDIPLDKRTFAQYQLFPAEKLGAVVRDFVTISPAGSPDGLYAHIRRQKSGTCPFFGPDRLCGIQKEYGATLLSASCSIYPRSLSHVDAVLEGTLSLSCPEVARNVLLNPNFMQVEGDLFSGDFRTDNTYQLSRVGWESVSEPFRLFHAVRSVLIEIVRDRSRPLWERLLLIGCLCMRLEGIASSRTEGAREGAVDALLIDYRQLVENEQLHAELQSLPSQPKLRLEVVLALTSERVEEKTCGDRFRDTFWTFVEGIGSASPSGPDDDLGRLLNAEQRYHRPFFERSPFILENYLLNYIFQNLFPFGQAGSDRFIPRSIFDEWILMTTQFAWIDTLLIGIAGHYQEAFGDEHVVRTIQSFTRAVAHYPGILNSIDEYIAARKLNNLRGMAVMLKS